MGLILNHMKNEQVVTAIGMENKKAGGTLRSLHATPKPESSGAQSSGPMPDELFRVTDRDKSSKYDLVEKKKQKTSSQSLTNETAKQEKQRNNCDDSIPIGSEVLKNLIRR